MPGMRRIAVLGMLLVAAPAAAQERAAAEALFQDGRKLAAAGKHAEACVKFKASDDLDPSVGARLQLGECNEKQGKTASAWLSFRDAENLATRLGDRKRVKVARREAARLEPLLSYVVVAAPPSSPDGLIVSFDGKAKPTALLGQRFPVDPGAHVVTASAPGHVEWKQSLAISAPGETRVQIPALSAVATTEPKPIEPDPPVTDPDPKPVEPNPQPDPVRTEPVAIDRGSGGGRKVLAYGVAAGGLALAATGLVFGSLARSAYNDRVDHCQVGNRCTPEGLELIDKAESRALWSTILTATGVAAVGAGVILYLTTPNDDGAATALIPTAGPGYAGFALTGAL